MKYVIVAGSFEYYHTWYLDPGSLFNAFLRAHDLTLGPPFKWNGGVTLTDFEAAADALHCCLKDLDDCDRNVIAYSNGGEPPLLLAAQGFPIRTLTTVGTPCRTDTHNTEAAQMIRYHQAVYDDIDPTRWVGEIIDGRPPRPYFPLARRYNLRNIGHGKVLFDQRYIPLWMQMGWIDAIRYLQTPAEEALA